MKTSSNDGKISRMNVRCARRYQIFFRIISRLACQWLSAYPFEMDLRVQNWKELFAEVY